MSSEQLTELRIVDKTTWPPGPWHDEPDRVQWQHAGYACLMVRSPQLGHWCGYVGVERAHSLYGKEYDEAHEIEVHGGLIYANKCSGEICHVPEPGMPDDVWWFGFDCAHMFDLSPGLGLAEFPGGRPIPPEIRRRNERHYKEDTYRDLEYVKVETEALAERLRDLA